MAHTYLQIFQQVYQDVGASGSAPTTCQNLVGEPKRIADWVNAAWLDVQEQHEDWDWLRKPFTLQTVAEQPNYAATAAISGITNAAIADFGIWKKSSLRGYVTSMGYSNEMIMPWVDYEVYRNLYQYGNMRTTYNRPVCFTIGPLRDLWLGTTPDAVGYTIDGDYYSTPLPFVLDADTPPTAFPDRFWWIIVHRAKMFYAAFEEDEALYASAQYEYLKLLGQLHVDQIPPLGYGESFA